MNRIDREDLFLKTLINGRSVKGIGDDAVAIGKCVFAADSFVEGSHFKREWFSLREIAFKSLSVNVSDIYAMGAVPRYALLCITIPKSLSATDVCHLAEAVDAACLHYGILLVGGDSIVSPLLGFHWTLIGQKMSQQYSNQVAYQILHSPTSQPRFQNCLESSSYRWVMRKGVKRGDIFAFSGTIGDSKKTFQCLMRQNKFENSQSRRNQRFKQPIPHSVITLPLRDCLHAGIDISDGLAFELRRLCKQNHCGVRMLRKFSSHQMQSGEEYEMLFAIPRQKWLKSKRIAKRFRLPLNAFGVAIRGVYKPYLRGHYAG
ncbi:hypothetical protein CCZ01_03530 [Helicobacter monodelphidis]|uniref:AIR synthase related protein n=1 Tax=Helicobacter sp. 15-1451 TaxID=2004995 RepID=UPI000DCDCC51|nr:AIR synthase related protein [Helicobacter sp. 15-1451]RAX58157.1 hypothetical protein CCZ01_03530 [Helicobacter sp. 15-1451]